MVNNHGDRFRPLRIGLWDPFQTWPNSMAKFFIWIDPITTGFRILGPILPPKVMLLEFEMSGRRTGSLLGLNDGAFYHDRTGLFQGLGQDGGRKGEVGRLRGLGEEKGGFDSRYWNFLECFFLNRMCEEKEKNMRPPSLECVLRWFQKNKKTFCHGIQHHYPPWN